MSAFLLGVSLDDTLCMCTAVSYLTNFAIGLQVTHLSSKVSFGCHINNKKLSYCKETVRLLHNIEIRVLH